MKCNLCDNPGNGTSKDLRGWPPGYCGFLGNVSFWFRQGGTPNDIKYPCFITKLCPHLDRYFNLPGPVALADPRINLIAWHAWVTVIKRSKGLVTLFILTAYFCARQTVDEILDWGESYWWLESGSGASFGIGYLWSACLWFSSYGAYIYDARNGWGERGLQKADKRNEVEWILYVTRGEG